MYTQNGFISLLHCYRNEFAGYTQQLKNWHELIAQHFFGFLVCICINFFKGKRR